jgi:hypothetical protein
MINGFLGRVLCCLLPLALVGLFGIGIGGYGLITGKGGSRIDSMGQKVGRANPLQTRVVGFFGLAAGFMFIMIAIAMGVALALSEFGGVTP